MFTVVAVVAGTFVVAEHVERAASYMLATSSSNGPLDDVADAFDDIIADPSTI